MGRGLDASPFRRHAGQVGVGKRRYDLRAVSDGVEDATMRVEAIEEFVERIPATLKEKRGVYSVEFTVAERGTFLSKKKLTYSARFRIDEDKKELRFTEMLKESSSGVSSGGNDFGPGFGFKKETYKTGTGPREGSIEEQSKLFGAQYSYTFDSSKVRSFIEGEAVKAGYAFTYQITSLGL
jgi:hypothetical protein